MRSQNTEQNTELLYHFVDRLLEVVSVRPEGWPNVDVSTYGQMMNVLRQRVEALCDFFERKEGTRKEERVVVRLLSECALNLVEITWRQSPDYFTASPEFLKLCTERPEPLLEYDQLYCTPDSTERRVNQILQEIDREEGRVLFMGDDDLGSVALASHFAGEIHVFEFDDRILSHIHDKAPQVQCRHVDLVLGGIPKEMKETFDAIVLDPPWDEYHAWCFLHKALYCMKQSPHARIYLSFCPINTEYLEQKAQPFFRRFSTVGLTFEAISPSFHLYPLANTEFRDLLFQHLTPTESPLLHVLRDLPFGFSNLYKLRRTEHFRRNPITRWFSQWWHSQ